MTAPTFTLEVDAFGRLVLTLANGEVFVGVVPVRCFPFSAPEQWVSFCDPQGREVYCLPELGDVEPALRERVEADLAQREFLPQIRRIHAISSNKDPVLWRVETDRGDVQFTLTSEDHIRRLEPHGVLIADAQGTRYRILDTRTLDPHSRKLLSQYL